ncbi:hypothetical protein CJP74_06885 [Psittacicella melopsittaci]|uniref:Uncharacterized protein n=1 Tax=Psittacicella melopsittaci TaxID=2028576 RepID=A0A3A1Y2F0_9GAMM|nr:AzlD domain-containing protein [Psittacicella melopsittaci]RIY31611.1 hypothetical protein CJP74_06885 [Psittacicella melopsittaci]
MLPEFSHGYYFIVLVVLSLATASAKFLPLLVPRKYMQTKWLTALNRLLGLCIMTILTLNSLTIPDITHGAQANWELIGYEALALLTVLAVYVRFKSTLLAVIIGIACVNIPWLALVMVACILPTRDKFTNLISLKTLRRRKATAKNQAEQAEEARASIDTLTITESVVDSQKVARTAEAANKLNALQAAKEEQEAATQANQTETVKQANQQETATQANQAETATSVPQAETATPESAQPSSTKEEK